LDAEVCCIKPMCLMTLKPTLYVANVSENGFHDNPMLDALKAFANRKAHRVPVCAHWRPNCRIVAGRRWNT